MKYLFLFLTIFLFSECKSESKKQREEELKVYDAIYQQERAKLDSISPKSFKSDSTIESIQHDIQYPSNESLLSEIESRSDVVKAIISDAGGLCVAMDIDANKAEYVVSYFLKMAKNKHIKIKFCKIVSASDYKSDGTYMTGTKLAFENQE